MREILFRAKRLDNGEWIEGDLITYETGEVAILKKKFSKYGCEATEISHRIRVNPKTICQYTGLTDKNGNKIWENDICKCLKVSEWYNDEFISKMEWIDYGWIFDVPSLNCMMPLCEFDINQNWLSHIPEIEVLGNIFDNPELLS